MGHMQIHQYLTRANNALDEGDSRTAAENFLAVLKMMPNDHRILKDYVFAAADHDRESAVAELIRYSDAQNTPAGRAYGLELALPYIESLEREAKGLSAYSSIDANEPEFRFCGEFLASWERETERAALPLGLAKLAFLTRSWAECDVYLDKSGRGTIDPRYGAARFAGSWFDKTVTAVERYEDWMPVTVYAPDQGRQSRRVFAACDEPFHVKYGQWLGSSYALTNTRADFHLHLYDGAANKWGIGRSAEGTGHVGKDSARFYYAAARIIRLYQLMLRDPKPTIMVDADLFVTGSLDDVFKRLEGADIALCRMPGRLPFHTQMNASVFGVNPTEKGMEFLRRAAGFIAQSWLDKRHNVWCLDQLSLLCTLREMQSRDSGPDVVAVGPSVYDGTYRAALAPQKVSKHSREFPAYQAMMATLSGEDTCAKAIRP